MCTALAVELHVVSNNSAGRRQLHAQAPYCTDIRIARARCA